MLDNIQYQVRNSKKAKYPSLNYSPEKGLVVVIPDGLDLDIEEFILIHESWVNKQLLKNPIIKEFVYPNDIYIPYLNRKYEIEYIHIPSKRIKLENKAFDRLTISGNIKEDSMKKLLDAWLMSLAKKYLPYALNQVSYQIGLSYSSCKIKKLKTMWGCCSSLKEISLSHKMMLLPNNLINYILIHELCHTVHMNHSKRFWALVERYDKNFKRHKNSLKNISELIPSCFR